MQRMAVIGGTGLLNMATGQPFNDAGLEVLATDSFDVETPYGIVPLKSFTLKHSSEEKTLVFLQRHHNAGSASKPPHMINHHANIWALKHAKVDAVLSVCSVGCVAADFPPGRVGIAHQYIDFTGQTTTFHDEKAQFTSVTIPFDENMNKHLESTLREMQNLSDERLRFTYWLAQGPQFETAAEVEAIDRLGGEVVGMTMPREGKLCREVELPYAALLIGSNWAAGREPGDATADLNHESVSAEANRRLGPVWSCITSLLTQ